MLKLKSFTNSTVRFIDVIAAGISSVARISDGDFNISHWND
jgi:hypothetical protein